MHPSRPRHRAARGFSLRGMLCLAVLCLGAAVPARLYGQIAVTDASSAFHPVTTVSGSLLTDPFYDQQTGHGEADFIGFTAGTAVYVNGALFPTSAPADVPGFLVQSGSIAGDTTNTYLMFRFRLRDVNGSAWDPKPYAGTNVMVGADLNQDGSVDIVFGADSTGSTPKLVFLKPADDPKAGSSANTSPSTTDVGSYATKASTTLTTGGSGPVTFDYSASGTNYNKLPWLTQQNMNLTFAISYANLQQAIRDLGTVNGVDFRNFVVDGSTAMNFLAYTSTQTNAFNEDIYGGDISRSSDDPWAYSSSMDGDDIRPAPEFATVVNSGVLLATALGVLFWRHRRRATPAAAR